MRRLILIPIVGALMALAAASCTQQQEPADTAPAQDSGATLYTALDSGTAVDWQNDPQWSAMIGKFPRQDLIENSFEHHAAAFMGIEGLDEVISARYVVKDDSLMLFLSEDHSGLRFLRLSEFAASQSQVRPAPVAFDEGYSVVFHHRDLGWTLGGLKGGYLVGAASYRDSSLTFISRWVKALE